jgi:hypothetical protein
MVAKRRRSYGSRWVLPVKVRAHVLSLNPRHAGRYPYAESPGWVLDTQTLRTGGE